MGKIVLSIVVSISLLFSSISNSFAAKSSDNISYGESLKRFKDSVFFLDMIDAFEVLKNYPTVEAYQAVVKRLEAYLDMTPDQIKKSRTDFAEIVMLLLESLEFLGSKDDVDLVLEIHKWAFTNDLDEDILDTTTNVLEVINNIPRAKLKNSPEAGPEALKHSVQAVDHIIALAEVGKIYDTMAKEVKGQDHILNGLADLYLKDLSRSGNREHPEVFYFMGLPGNGKDTVAEAYVKAMWDGDKNAVTDHMFRMQIRNTNESWSYFGSGKGYVGSDEITDFLRFLVEHSGGKYLLNATPAGKLVIEHNPKWKGENLPGFNPPHKAVIFVNEIHNMPKVVKDNILKQGIEKGIYKITNPGNTKLSASTIELPITYIAASNEGISLLEPREKNGARIGEPLSYEKLIENYDRVTDDKTKLKQAIMQNNGEINNPVAGSDAPGTSEEFLSRIPDHRLFIMRPLSPDTLKDIAKIKIKNEGKALFEAKGRLGNYQIEVSKELIDFITTYKYIASENARPINGRIESFIFNQIDQALRSEKIRPLGILQHLYISLKEYANGAKAVVFYVVEPETESYYQFTRLIPETLKDIPNKPLSDERIQEIAKMRETMIENVFGVEHIVDALVDAAITSESEAQNKDAERPATVMAFLGMTSTGKTETAKQYVKARYGANVKPVIIDFNTIKTIDDLQARILGSVDSRKNPIESEFMKAYDRANGEIAFIFDEAANAPKELLKALYEILREKVANNFSDGKPRPMKNVTIILTGNAGEQIYRSVPTDLPTDIYERALHEVFKIFIKNEDLQRKLLAETFPEALLARIGKNIFHFGPLSHAGKRQVAQLKLLDGLKNLKAKPSERGWNMMFKDESSLLGVFGMIERDGFDHHSQGASIDKFVRESVIGKIKSKLLLENVPSNTEVIIDIEDGVIKRQDGDQEHSYRQLNMTLENGKVISIEIPISSRKKSLNKSIVDQVLTAYHEAGHEIVSEVFFGDRVRPKYLSVIEGVTIINGDFVHYAGLRTGETIERTELTKEVVLRHAAVWAAGYIAQGLVTTGGRHDSGKSDDMKRSTHLIQDAILRYGLSKEWGMRGIPANMSTEDYISKTLSSNEKEKLNDLTNRWLKEAAQLAREALLANSELLFPAMSKAISENGFITGQQIDEIYKANNLYTERTGQVYRDRALKIRKIVDDINTALEKHGAEFDRNFTDINYSLEIAGQAYDFLIKKNMGLWGYFSRSPWSKLSSYEQLVAGMYLSSRINIDSRDAKLSSQKWMPASVANIEDIIAAQRLNQTTPVTNTGKFVLANPEMQTSDLALLADELAQSGAPPMMGLESALESSAAAAEAAQAQPAPVAISSSAGSCEIFLQ